MADSPRVPRGVPMGTQVGALLFCGVVVVLVLLIVSAALRPQALVTSPMPIASLPSRKIQTSEARENELRRLASAVCQEFVKDRLKAPAAARFPNASETDTTMIASGADVFHVRSYVDAQNSFGALLRTPFVCEVIKMPGEDQWILRSLSMEQR